MFDSVAQSILEAWQKLLRGDEAVYGAVWVSLYCSVASTALATALGVPAGAMLGLGRFRGKHAVSTVMNTLMAVPTVVIGLLCYGLLSRSGPLGVLDILYSKHAIVAGELLLVVPVVIVLTQAAFEQQDPRGLKTLKTLGASPLRIFRTLVLEARFGVMAGVVLGFGRAVGEVGIAMMVGGNIKDYTRTMTTAIALETSKGEFALGLALGTILLVFAFGANVLFRHLQAKGQVP